MLLFIPYVSPFPPIFLSWNCVVNLEILDLYSMSCFFLILWYILLQNVEHLYGLSYPFCIFWNGFFSVPVLGNSFIFNPTRSAFSPVGILHLTEVKLVQRIKYLIQSYTVVSSKTVIWILAVWLQNHIFNL